MSTLAELRTRIQTQLQSASGQVEPLPVTTSSKTLANIRDRVELALQDTGNAIWDAGDVDEAITQALDIYSRSNPQHKIGTVTVSTAGREQSISTLTGVLRVEKVWWDYDSTTPGYPPHWRQFEVWPGSILYIDDDDAPAIGDVIRIWYTLKHAIEDLDSATATTVPDEDISYIVIGAAAFAARMRAAELAEQATVDDDVVDRLMSYAKEMESDYRRGVWKKLPAWQRRAYGYAQEDIDEAIRWALHRYNEIEPARAITTVTLTADGREVDISSLTYHQIERVWWDYDSSDPVYPANWRDFELWPGDILYIKDGNEPITADVVRIWYTYLQTIEDLDSATATTVPTNHETLLVIGASGFAAQERAQDQTQSYVPSKIREWAEARLKEFEAGLERLATRQASRESGIAKQAAIDRWDNENTGWW